MLRTDLIRSLGGTARTPRRNFAERVTALVDDAQFAKDEQANRMLGSDVFKVRIPSVVKYVLSRSQNPSEVLEIGLDLRESKDARRFRGYCARVDVAIAEGRRDDVVKACAELSKFGLRFEESLSQQMPAAEAALDAVGVAKELVSIGSPLLGALVPGASAAAAHLGRRARSRKFAFIERLTGTPRNLNQIERVFAELWPSG